MNTEDIIRMAREAGLPKWYETDGIANEGLVVKFANLVAEAERERIKWDSIHSCHPECDKPVCVAMRKAVLEEREACAKVCDLLSVDRGMIRDEVLKEGVLSGATMCALVIRERGAP